MNLPFGKKKKAGEDRGSAASMAGRRPAAERVSSLSAQGLSEPEIIRELRTEGYTPMEVDSAMKQALRSAVDSPQAYQQAPQTPASPGFSPRPMPPSGADRRRIFPEEAAQPSQLKPPFALDEMQRIERGTSAELPQLPGIGPPLPDETPEDDLRIPGIGDDISQIAAPAPAQRQGSQAASKRQLEEMAEAIVEEKAELFRSELDQVMDEIKKLEARLQVFEERFNQIDSKKKTELDRIMMSITSYKESIADVSARMESIEKAMKDSMTPMLQTLRSLSDTVKDIKKK